MMFPDQNTPYPFSHTSDASSEDFSFCSPSSGDTTYTPPSTRRESFDSDSFENASFIDYGSASCFSMPSISSEELPAMPDLLFAVDYKMPTDPEMFNLEPFLHTPFNPSHGLQLLPSSMPSLISHLQSPLSDLGSSEHDFVDPSQTFIDAYDCQSPACVTDYNSSSMSEYTRSSYSPSDSMLYIPFSDDLESSSTTPSMSTPLHQPLCEPLSPSLSSPSTTPETLPPGKKPNTTRNPDLLATNNIRYQGRAKKECPWAGCTGKFQRQEHLKRHERTHLNSDSFPCQFCAKPFGRSDNLKSHMKLHTHPGKKSSRTDYFPDAVRVYAEMSRKPRRGSGGAGGVGCRRGPREDGSKVMRSRGATCRQG